jgi:hypothetical protein
MQLPDENWENPSKLSEESREWSSGKRYWVLQVLAVTSHR